MLGCLSLELLEVTLMRQGSIHRWLAVLFLIVASADISADVISPQECCEELASLAIFSDCNREPLAQAPDAALTLDAADREEPSSTSGAKEECFCCCAHILPGAHFESGGLEIERVTSILANAILPIPPPQGTYHPPRLS